MHTTHTMDSMERRTVARLAAVFSLMLLLLQFVLARAATAQDFVWARSAGGIDSDRANGVATDAAGDAYVTGIFRATAIFGAGEANETTLDTTGGEDAFLAKYDATGALRWARRAGGVDFDGGFDVATDLDGNVYMTGYFRETANFGRAGEQDVTLRSQGEGDVFLAKYDRDGSILWARRAGGPAFDLASSIATDAAGNVYVTGAFNEAAGFGSVGNVEIVLESAGVSDVFIAKYDRSGNLLWARSGGGFSFDTTAGVAVDRDGHAYIAGQFFETVTFGAGEVNETTLDSFGEYDVFLAKYDATGAFLWATNAGGSSGDSAGDVAVDPAGDAYVIGNFAREATFGSRPQDEIVLESQGLFDVFLAKYDREGDLDWARRDGGTGSEIADGLATDDQGGVFATGAFGSFGEPAIFGEGEARETTLTNAGSGDVFVARYDADGTLSWARSGGGADPDIGYGVAADADGNAYVVGQFHGTAAIFGSGEPNETELAGSEGEVFVAKFARAPAGQPSVLVLTAPKVVRVSTDICVQGRVTDAARTPLPGIVVAFEVTGADLRTGEATTDARGSAEFCYTAGDLPGRSDVTATVRGTTVSDTATVAIVPPETSNRCTVLYAGRISAATGSPAKASGFSFVVRGDPRGDQDYVELGVRSTLRVNSRTVDALVCGADRASLFGRARAAKEDVVYRIDLREAGRGRGPRFRIRLDNGYDSGDQELRSGFAVIDF